MDAIAIRLLFGAVAKLIVLERLVNYVYQIIHPIFSPAPRILKLCFQGWLAAFV